ncbi:MAG TPA: bifunctional DNA primase/polymerase [Terracidiphilus sp.]|jgi:hypothetical protein|nr:bifunctional DNA primase/polymerase [Terracidiphilus sp.]
MNNFLEIALDCIRRGWYTFPCAPRTKIPRISKEDGGHGYKNATIDETQVRAWWEKWPDSNVPIATGASGLCVLDIDSGITDEAELRAWMAAHGLPDTYAVRTGRRPDFGVQLYYAGTDLQSKGWEQDGCKGDIRCSTGLVMAAGSTHKSGERYAVLWGLPLATVPDYIRTLTTPAQKWDSPTDVDEATAEGWKTWLLEYMARNDIEATGFEARSANGWRIGIVCPWCEQHSSGKVGDSSTILCILDGHIAFKCSHGTCDANKRNTAAFKQLMVLLHNETEPEPGEGPEVVIGSGTGLPMPKQEPIEWRTRYMTEDAFLNVKPPEFLIDGFLVKKSIAMLGGPVAQRKSIIALNIAHALCTGDPLFGYFNVTEKPTRTVYLCPEMGAASFVKRIRQIGLGEHIGKTLFIQTMSEQPTALDELDGELPGAVVLVDTITRFIEGDENKSDDMRLFARKVFRLVNAGATVVLLHHSKKGSSGSLDDGLRGSSELAAFVDSCWVTELEDTKKPYESLSKVRNVKQRDFESDPFRLKPAPGSYYLTMDGDPAPEAVVSSKKEAAAREALAAILQQHPKMGINKLREVLKAKGHGKGNRWITEAVCALRPGGAVLSSD